VSRKYAVRDEYGRRVGTLEVPSDPTGCLVTIVIVVLVLIIGFALVPILFGGWLVLSNWKRQSYWLKGLWVVSCFFVAFTLAGFLGQFRDNLGGIPLWFFPLLVYVPMGLIGTVIVIADFALSFPAPQPRKVNRTQSASPRAISYTSPTRPLATSKAGGHNWPLILTIGAAIGAVFLCLCLVIAGITGWWLWNYGDALIDMIR